MNAALTGHVPPDVMTRADITYGPDATEKLDIHRPASSAYIQQTKLPTIIWIFGGGFLSGDKSQVANYLKILAASGYAVVGVNYALAPRAQHPQPTRQVNAALDYLKTNADALGLDLDRVFLAGDSAGAQIAAQLGIAIVTPEYAKSIGVVPAISRAALRGLMLYCGIHDPDNLNAEGAMGGFLKTVAWSYLGSRSLGRAALPFEFSIVRNVSPPLPPLFITAGNADPLLPHSLALVAAAEKAGVTVDALFFEKDYQPPLQHEYQFDLDHEAGRVALQRSLAFLAAHR